MGGQDHGKNHLPGHDSHGVHVCHKCGWPFTNQHPSARHRRAHKRVCGTLEGYKLLEAELDIHSDDEDLSDDDRNTPSPKLVDRDVKEKGTVGIEQGSIKQGDEKSLETGRKLAENVEKTTENDPDYAKLLKNEIISTMEEPKNSTNVTKSVVENLQATNKRKKFLCIGAHGKACC